MAKKTNKTKEAFTVKDFKMWLMGMTEFQEAGWTPNAKQWKAVLEKIEMLEEQAAVVQAITTESPRQPQQSYHVAQPQITFTNETNGGVGAQPSTHRFPSLLDTDPGFAQPDQGRAAPARPITAGTGIVGVDVTKSFI